VSARSVVQLLAVGAVLVLLIGPDRPLVGGLGWVVVMVVIAADVVGRRVPDFPDARRVALGAGGVAVVVTLLIVFGLGVFPLEGRAVVPVAGMTVGNTLGALVLALRQCIEAARSQRDEIEARLVLGLDADAAAGPIVRRALRDAVTPQVESTRTVGLIALPGTMTGLILAGVDPVDAVLAQAVVMLMILASVTIAVTLAGRAAVSRLITADLRLAEVVAHSAAT